MMGVMGMVKVRFLRRFLPIENTCVGGLWARRQAK